MVLSTILGIAGAFVYTYRQAKIDEANCQILIETNAPQVLQVKDAVELGTGTMFAPKEFFETQYRIIQSSAVAQKVADKLGLAHDPDYAALAVRRPGGDPLTLARALARQVSVRPVKDTRVSQIVASRQQARTRGDFGEYLRQRPYRVQPGLQAEGFPRRQRLAQ